MWKLRWVLLQRTTNTNLNNYAVSSDSLEIGPYPIGLPFGQALWFVAAFVNKLVPCAWLLSGALEVRRLRLRLLTYLQILDRLSTMFMLRHIRIEDDSRFASKKKTISPARPHKHTNARARTHTHAQTHGTDWKSIRACDDIAKMPDELNCSVGLQSTVDRLSRTAVFNLYFHCTTRQYIFISAYHQQKSNQKQHKL